MSEPTLPDKGDVAGDAGDATPATATEGSGRVALVLVSHSERLAEGAVELAEQMAPGLVILPAGGMDGGGLGTSYDRVSQAVSQALESADAVAVLADLGSAVLTVESVLELDDDLGDRVRLADAPFVEGAVAAAVTAHGGAGLDQVIAAAEGAGRLFSAASAALAREAADRTGSDLGLDESGPGTSAAPGSTATSDGQQAATEPTGAARATVVVRNRLGLHARPAALLARMIASSGATVTINGVNGASVLELMTLGAVGGHELAVEAVGPQADEVLSSVVEAIEGGFGET